MPVEELGKLERAWAGFRIMGGDGTAISGSPRDGYTFNVADCESGSGETGGTSPGTGACCFEDTSCLILSSSDCAGASGVYQGDGTVCDPNPCVGCPVIDLVCDQITASSCGWLAFDDTLHFFLTRTEDYTASFSCSGQDWCPCLSCATSYDRTDIYTVTVDGDGNCHFPGCTSGSGTCNTACTPSPPGENCIGEYDCLNEDCVSCGGDSGQGTCDIAPFFTNTCGTGGDTITDTMYTCHADNRGGTATETFTLSDENAGSFPAYDDSFSDLCVASRSSGSGGTFPFKSGAETVSRFRPKFTFPAATINFTIHYHEHFVPDVGAPSDTSQSVGVSIGDTEVIGPEVLEPTDNGTITITDIVCIPL